MKLTTIYTKTGDKGTTSLADGTRIPKNHVRPEAYGTVDETNATVGLARAFAQERCGEWPQAAARLETELERIQQLLFNLGSDLATPQDTEVTSIPRISKDDVDYLEALIDELNADLGALGSFILPGGGPVSGCLHQARTICRRAERRLLRLAETEDIGAWPLPFINRLADVFFVLSRWVAKQMGEKEILWRPRR